MAWSFFPDTPASVIDIAVMNITIVTATDSVRFFLRKPVASLLSTESKKQAYLTRRRSVGPHVIAKGLDTESQRINTQRQSVSKIFLEPING